MNANKHKYKVEDQKVKIRRLAYLKTADRLTRLSE